MIYRLILSIRHSLYDSGKKKSFPSPVPSICIGNITAGGTGKTPFTEMVLRKLAWKGSLAVLSLGYGRKGKGFKEVLPEGDVSDYGDEPLQIARKFPGVKVAVDKDRVEGCMKLATDFGASLIVLDDAFQYRRLRPGMSFVLVDYNRPIYKDRLLPWGRLRDLPSRLEAASAVVVTKCPAHLDEWVKAEVRQKLGMRPGQQLFFAGIRYLDPEPVFLESADRRYLYSKGAVVFSGIASDGPMLRQLSDTYKIEEHLKFPDHHKYRKGDIRKLHEAMRKFPTACFVTTEKDAQRLRAVKNFPKELSQRLFFLPIDTYFLSAEDDAAFTEMLQSL